jgi:hypothetical protein
MICTPYQILFAQTIQEKSDKCREERCIQGFGWGNLYERDHLKTWA